MSNGLSGFGALKPNLGEVARKVASISKENTRVALVVQGLHDTQPLLTIGGDDPLPSASLTKLFTAYAALGLLGPKHTFKTKAFVPTARLKNGVLHGSLVVKGYGDPFLVSERLWLFAQLIASRGIQEIRGDVVIDQSYFCDYPDTLVQSRSTTGGRPYQALITPTALNFNAVAFGIFHHLESPERFQVSVYPYHPDVRVRHQLQAISEGRSQVQVEYQSATGQYMLSGKATSGRPTYVYESVRAPSEYVGSALIHSLRAAGVKVYGKAAVREKNLSPIENTAGMATLEFESLPLAELVRLMNLYSNNFMADILVFAMGAQENTASYVRGKKRMLEWLGGQGIVLDPSAVELGSGLSLTNRMPANTIARLLKTAWQNSEIGLEFFSGLPTPGREGTLNRRHLPFVRAKTGSLSHVSNLAGLIYGGSTIYAFVLMVHGPSLPDETLNHHVEEVTQELARFLR